MMKQEPLSIKEIIAQFIDVNDMGQKLDETQLIRLWPKIAGETVNTYTQSLQVHNHTLYVHLTSAVLRNELMMLRNELLRRYTEEFGHPVIDNIVFR